MCQAKTSLGNGSFKVHSTKLEKANRRQIHVCFQHFSVLPATMCTVQNGTESGWLVLVSFISVFRKMRFLPQFILRDWRMPINIPQTLSKRAALYTWFIAHVMRTWYIAPLPPPPVPLAPLLEWPNVYTRSGACPLRSKGQVFIFQVAALLFFFKRKKTKLLWRNTH